MNKRELDGLLSQKAQIRTALFFGQFHYHIQHYAKKIIDAVEEPKEVLRLYFDEYNFETAKTHLDQSSLFGDALVLHVKTSKKIPKQELLTLAKTAEKRQSTFVYEYLDDLSNRDKEYYESVSAVQNSHFVRFFTPNRPDEWAALGRELAAYAGVSISPKALNDLFELCSFDVAICENELKKLSILNRPIEPSDIHALVAGSGEIDMERLFDEIIFKRSFAQTLEQILRQDDEETNIVRAFQAYIYRLFLFYLYIKVNGQSDPLKILGHPLPIHVAQAMAQKAMKLDFSKYNFIFDQLFELDYALKYTKCDKRALLFASFMKLKTSL